MDGGVAQQIAATATDVRVPLVNKKELARLLDVSLPTLDALIENNDDFPIESRGSNGNAYEFDPAKVQTWREGKAAKERAAHADRMRALGTLDLGDQDPARDEPGKMLTLARFERERRKLNQEAGLLVDIASLRQELLPAVVDLASMLDGLADNVGRRLNLGPTVTDQIREYIDDARLRFVQKIEDALAPATDSDIDNAA